MSPGKIFTALHPCENSRINILPWILTKLGTYIVLMSVWNPIDFQGQRSRGQIFTAKHPCENSRINILQGILTKLGTYLVLRRVWNLLIVKVIGQRLMSPVKFLLRNILVNTLESTSFNGF